MPRILIVHVRLAKRERRKSELGVGNLMIRLSRSFLYWM